MNGIGPHDKLSLIRKELSRYVEIPNEFYQGLNMYIKAIDHKHNTATKPTHLMNDTALDIFENIHKLHDIMFGKFWSNYDEACENLGFGDEHVKKNEVTLEQKVEAFNKAYCPVHKLALEDANQPIILIGTAYNYVRNMCQPCYVSKLNNTQIIEQLNNSFHGRAETGRFEYVQTEDPDKAKMDGGS